MHWGKMKPRIKLTLPAVMLCAGIIVAAASGFAIARAEEATALEADHAFVLAVEKSDTTALGRLLDTEFNWIDSNGETRSKAQILAKLPALKNGDVEAVARDYGHAAVVRANRDRVQVLRVWAKRPYGWRAILYQEVTLVAQPEHSPTGAAGSGECENPCRSIPLQPQTESEKAAIASWQGVMRAMANNDVEAYSPLIAEEFTATDTHHTAAFNQ